MEEWVWVVELLVKVFEYFIDKMIVFLEIEVVLEGDINFSVLLDFIEMGFYGVVFKEIWWLND